MKTIEGESTGAQFVKATVLSVMVLLFGLFCGLLPTRPPHIPSSDFSAASTFYDCTHQLRAHKGILLGVIMMVLVLARAKGRLPRLERFSSWLGGFRSLGRAIAIVAPFVVILLAFVDRPSPRSFVLVILLLGSLIWFGPRLGATRWVKGAVVAVLILCSAMMIIPGFAKVPDLTAPIPIGSETPADLVEVHYSIVVSQGDRLSQGMRLFTNVMPHYGFLEPFALAVAEKTRGLMDFGSHIRMIQVMQVVFALAAFFCYWNWSGRDILATTIVFLPILGFVHTSHASVFCPNQSGWRFLGLPLGLLLLVTRRPSDKRDIQILGFALGLLMLFNPETGIAVGSAYVTYILTAPCRSPITIAATVRGLLKFGLSIAVAPLAFIFIYRLCLGYYPFPSTTGPSYALAKFAGGYGGLKIYFSITWIAILVQCVFVISRASLSIDRLSARRRIRFSIAVATLVWFAYFANRPHPWNLWTFWFLYGFFIVEFLRRGQLARFKNLLRQRRIVMPMALVLVFAVTGIAVVDSGLRDNVKVIKQKEPPSAEILSGVLLPKTYAEIADNRARFVRETSRTTSMLYFTSNTFLMPLLSGVVCDLPFSDPYVEGFTGEDFERTVDWIESKHPMELLFDASPVGETAPSPREIFIAHLKSRLSTAYRHDGNTNDWEVWKRRTTAGVEGRT